MIGVHNSIWTATKGTGGGGSFTPANVPNLAIWLRADSNLYQNSNGTVPASTDGDPVGFWGDKSGNNHNFIQVSATNKPAYKANILNAKPVVRFTFDTGDNSDSDYFAADGFASPAALEVFIVVKVTEDPPINNKKTGLWSFAATATGVINSHYTWTDGVIYDCFGTDPRQTTVDPVLSLTSFRLYNIVSRIGEWSSYLDGVQIYTTVANTVVGLPVSIMLGKSADDYWMDGDIAEFILYGAKLSDPNKAAVENYIATRYGMTIS